MPRCPTCGGMNLTDECRLCKIRNTKPTIDAKPPEPAPLNPVIRGFPAKFCKYCGTPLQRKHYKRNHSKAKWESPAMYARRKYCGNKCAHKHQYQNCVARGVIKDA